MAECRAALDCGARSRADALPPRRSIRALWWLVFLVAALDHASVAFADDEAEPDDQIDVITVYGPRDRYRVDTNTSATRTPTPIDEVPQSISVIPRELIEDQLALSVSEALRNASGVVQSNPLLTPAFDNTLIRGFAAEQLVDGFTQYYNPGDRDSTSNVELIEVLRGPNGVLYGGGSGAPVGGVINIVTRSPEQTPSRWLGFRTGSDQLLQPYVDLNQPLFDRAAVRFTGEYTSAESYVDRIEVDRFNANPSVLVTLGPSTELLVRGRVSRWQQPDYQGLSATGTIRGDVDVRRKLFIGPDDVEDSHSKYWNVSASLDHASELWSSNLSFRYGRSDFDERVRTILGQGFVDFGADIPVLEPPELAEVTPPFFAKLPFGLFDGRLYQEQEEVTAVANAFVQRSWGPTEHTLLLGGDFSRYDDDGFLNFVPVVGSDGLLAFVDLAAPQFPEPFTDLDGGENDTHVRNDVAGGYVQLQSTLFDRLHLLTSVRLAYVRIDFASPDNRDVTEETRPIPRVGAVLDLTEWLGVYGGYSQGIRGQPFANFSTPPEPEESSQWEVGLKLSVPRLLSGYVAYYEIERENVSVPDPEGGLGTSPQGRQSSRGAEVELLWGPFAGASVWTAYAYTRAGFEDDLFAFASDGDRLPGVPEHSGRVWVDYAFDMAPLVGLRMGAGCFAQSKTQISLRNEFFSDAFYTVDASVGYAFEWHTRLKLRLNLSIKNVTDNDYFVRLGYLGSRAAPGQPRSVFADVSLGF